MRGRVLWAVALCVVSAALTIHPEHDSDLYWHMKLGQAVLAHGSRTVPDPISFEDFGKDAVVPEWLWGAATLGMYELWGYPALHLLLAILAALSAAALVPVLRRFGGSGAVMLVSSAAMASVLGRIRVRPEAAMSALLPATLLIVERYAEATEKTRARWGAALVAVEVFWAQVHGSFVLVPALYALRMAPAWLDEGQRERAQQTRTLDLAVLAALLLGLCSSAYGIQLLGYLLAHTNSDATRHLADMHPPIWNVFDPTERFYGPLYLALWLAGLLGMAASRRLFLVELGYALLGAFFVSSAVRFLALGTVLVAPLATRGVDQLLGAWERRPLLRYLAPLLALLPLHGIGRRLADKQGPLGVLGPAPSLFPFAAAEYLRKTPEVKRVLTNFWAGPPLNFLLDGRVRTYVDGRTPLFFDETEYAVSRDIFRVPSALTRVIAQYHPDALVIGRYGPACSEPPSGFVPVITEPRYTTFVRAAQSSALESVLPCGPELVRPDLCANRAAFERDLLRLKLPGNEALLGYLSGELALRCDGDAARAARLLPERYRAAGFEAPRDRALALAYFARGDAEQAAQTLAESIAQGDPNSLQLLHQHVVDVSAETSRALFESFFQERGDSTPAWAHYDLGVICAAQDDAECVRFHGLRAAVANGASATVPLTWLVQHAPEPRVQKEAARWLETIIKEPAQPPQAPP